MTIYRALTIRSPWWEKILSGEKTIETRTWPTNFRGEFLICAAQPEGKIVAVAELADCKPMSREDWQFACCDPYPNAWGFFLKNVRKISRIKICGQQRFFSVEAEIETC